LIADVGDNLFYYGTFPKTETPTRVGGRRAGDAISGGVITVFYASFRSMSTESFRGNYVVMISCPEESHWCCLGIRSLRNQYVLALCPAKTRGTDAVPCNHRFQSRYSDMYRVKMRLLSLYIWGML